MIASTKRAQIAGGRATAPVTHLTGIKLMQPLIPVGQELVNRHTPKSVSKPFSCGIAGNPDIIEGDILVVGAVEYSIVWVGIVREPLQFLKLYVDEVK